jgi:hypothetical protein
VAPAPAPRSSAAASFLRASCASALQLEDACYSLLLPYADSFHGSIARIARTSATLAVERQHNLTDELARLKLHGTGAGRIADMGLSSCSYTVATSYNDANVTLGLLDDLVAGIKSKEDFEWKRSLVQSWLDSSGSVMGQCVDWNSHCGCVPSVEGGDRGVHHSGTIFWHCLGFNKQYNV